MGISKVLNADILKEIQQLKVLVQNLGNKKNDQNLLVKNQKLDEQTNLALHFAPIAIFLLRDGLIRQPNAEASRIYGKPIMDLVKQPFLDSVVKEDRKKVKELLESVLQSDQSGRRCTYRIQSEKGSELWLELTALRLNDSSDSELICYQTDVSDLQQSKENLGIYSEHLEEIVKLRTNELQIALEKAEIANKLKDIFLQNMSHEFRTPIHQINSLSEIGFNKAEKSLRKKPDSLLEKMQDFFLDINNASLKLFSFILNLFDLSTLESGDVTLYFRQCSVAQALIEPQMKLTEKLKEKNIELIYEFPDSPIMVECDISLVNKALGHILENAIKFSPEHSEVKIILKSQIESQSEDTPKPIAIDIEDEGVGVPESELETIFEKFTQSSRTDDGSGGNGIGLAICKQIIQKHHGRIWAENRKNKGLKIKIILPSLQSDQVEETPESSDINKITFKSSDTIPK
jgi:PAS domain S-box-containing protein